MKLTICVPFTERRSAVRQAKAPAAKISLAKINLRVPEFVAVGVVEAPNNQPGPERRSARDVEVLADDDLDGGIGKLRDRPADGGEHPVRNSWRLHLGGEPRPAGKRIQAKLDCARVLLSVWSM